MGNFANRVAVLIVHVVLNQILIEAMVAEAEWRQKVTDHLLSPDLLLRLECGEICGRKLNR